MPVVRNLLKILVSLGLLAILVIKLDWSDVVDRAVRLSWWTLPVAVAMQIFVWACANSRWWILIRIHGLGHTYSNLFKPTYIGAFFNNLLPSSTGGDLFRMYHIYRQGHGAAVAVSPIVTERAVGLMSMVALAALSISLFGGNSQFFDALRMLLFWLLAGSVAGVAVISVPATYYGFHRFLGRWNNFTAVAGLLHVTEAAHEYLCRPRLLVSLIGISLVLHGLHVLIFMVLGAGIGASLSPTQYLFIVPVVLVAASIPVTVGGLGVREATAITLFTAAGMAQEDAAAVSLLFIPVLLLSGLPGLWFFLRMKGHRQFYRRATHTDFSDTR